MFRDQANLLKPILPHGNGKLENSHNFLKQSIVKFLPNTDLEWDDVIPIATYVYNISPNSQWSRVTVLPCVWMRPNGR